MHIYVQILGALNIMSCVVDVYEPGVMSTLINIGETLDAAPGC
jgi:hypothetical protein